MDVNDSLGQLEALLTDVAEHLKAPNKAARRAAALKLDRIVAIASTLAATVHTIR
ncbi:MAG: hypothetical protein ABL897_01305 [Hyphomicrobium sp.]